MRVGMSPIRSLAALFVALPLVAAAHPTPPPTAAATPAEARAFVERVNRDLAKLYYKQATAEWIKSTYITDDTERNAASVNDDVLAYVTSAVLESKRFAGLPL